MDRSLSIRAAVRSEAELLSDLCRRSKAHWGYDDAFMRQSDPSLTIRDDWIAAGDVLVCEQDGHVAGVAAIEQDEGRFEVASFFVEPADMGKGVGAMLFKALLNLARDKRIDRLFILSDPNAADFYAKMGARLVGEEPSDAIAGRTLPLLEIDLSS